MAILLKGFANINIPVNVLQGLSYRCQGKVEMSPSRQIRNVVFGPCIPEMHVNLRAPVKRRRAMLASNPIRNSRPELIADDEKDAALPTRSFTWARGRPAGGGTVLTPGFGFDFDFGHIGPIDSACLGKRILRALSISIRVRKIA